MKLEVETYLNLVKNLYKSENKNSLIRMYIKKAIEKEDFREGIIDAFFLMEENRKIEEKERFFYREKRMEISNKIMDVLFDEKD